MPNEFGSAPPQTPPNCKIHPHQPCGATLPYATTNKTASNTRRNQYSLNSSVFESSLLQQTFALGNCKEDFMFTLQVRDFGHFCIRSCMFLLFCRFHIFCCCIIIIGHKLILDYFHNYFRSLLLQEILAIIIVLHLFT